MKITFARQSDAEPIARMSRALVESGLTWSWRSRRVGRAIADEETLAVVARSSEGAILGFAFMHYGEKRAHLMLLAVSPRARRRGIGRELIDWHLACCRTAGIGEVVLEVRESNRAARAFYERLGFCELERVPSYYDGREDAVRLSLSLGPETS